MARGKDVVITSIPLQAEPRLTPARQPRFDAERVREIVGWALVVVAVLLVFVVANAPAPYVIEVPGSTADTLGTAELADGSEVDLISVDGTEVYPSDGRLDLVTVGVIGSPDAPPTWLDVLGTWFRPGVTAVPMEQLYPPGASVDDIAAEGAMQMERSQREAVAAALGELAIPVDTTVEVNSVLSDGPSAGILQTGDILMSVDGEAVTDGDRLRELLDAHGVDTPAAIVVERAGDELTVSITPEAYAAEDDRPVLGILVIPSFDFPFAVTIQLENVGGPSAGLMFALGVYDRLTPGALPGGAHIAGTGTIDAAGAVGAIGGIRQKLHAAERDGAQWFLVPQDNCAEAVDVAPAGLVLVSVDTLDDAIGALDGIARGADAQALPRCAA